MRAFRKGHVDIIQTVLPTVEPFVMPRWTNGRLWGKEGEAVKRDAGAYCECGRTSRGRGFARHFYALQEVRKEESKPGVFADGVYAWTRPSKIMTDCTEWTNGVFLEGGWVMPNPEHVWVHYDVREDEYVCFLSVMCCARLVRQS
jgi:Choline/Carnitine o-acyltransferase